MLNLPWYYGNLFCCIPSCVVTLHWALGTKTKTMKVHGQWACPSLTWSEGQVLFFVYLSCPFVDFFPTVFSSIGLSFSPYLVAYVTCRVKLGLQIGGRLLPSGTDYTFTQVFKTLGEPALGLQGQRLECQQICAFFFKLQVLEHIVLFFRGTTCAHTFMTPTLPRTIMSRWCGTNMALNAVFHVAL
jgi:hypothetical protein